MRNNIEKFTKDTATTYADTVEKNKTDKANKIANKLIKHIEARYEKAIKKAINKSANTKQVKINLPHYDLLEDEVVLSKVKTAINEYFSKLGFYIAISNPKHCDWCPFDIICNYGSFHIVIKW
jgi:phenylalanyl-tRNA synthetase alpha subunit